VRQLKEKYFDYFAFNIVDYIALLRRQLRLATLEGSLLRIHANYRQRSGARHQLAPECRK
jgi:hypothetical protein